MRTILNNIIGKAIAAINPTTAGVLKDFEKTVKKLEGVSRFQKLRAKSHTDFAAQLQTRVAKHVSKSNEAIREAEAAHLAAVRINKLLNG